MTNNEVVPAFDPRTVDVRLLGGVSISIGSRSVAVHRRAQLVAASLFLAGTRIPADRLCGQVWGDGESARSRSALYDVIRDLRDGLDAAWPGGRQLVVQEAGTYRIAAGVSKLQIDVHRFHTLLKEATELNQRGESGLAATQYRLALEQWGDGYLAEPVEPLVGLDGTWAESIRQGLKSDHRAGLLNLLDLQLKLRQHAQAVPTLTRLNQFHPYSERVAELYMLALCRTGEPTEAEAVYRRLDARLREDCGRDPGERVQQLHQRILRGEEGLELLTDHADPPPPHADGEQAPPTDTHTRRKRADAGRPDGSRPLIKNKASSFEAGFVNFGIVYGRDD